MSEEERGVFVKVARLGSVVKEVFLETDHPTVGDAMEIAEVEMEEGWDLRVGGESASEEDSVSDGDIITLIPRIKGGQ